MAIMKYENFITQLWYRKEKTSLSCGYGARSELNVIKRIKEQFARGSIP